LWNYHVRGDTTYSCNSYNQYIFSVVAKPQIYSKWFLQFLNVSQFPLQTHCTTFTIKNCTYFQCSSKLYIPSHLGRQKMGWFLADSSTELTHNISNCMHGLTAYGLIDEAIFDQNLQDYCLVLAILRWTVIQLSIPFKSWIGLRTTN